MASEILGLHHVTAIAGNAQRNYDFYTKVLGLRMVKKTVNFDDPGTYHFYYGDEMGSPGTILTFFPWEGIKAGRTGTGMVTEIGYAVPNKSLEFWTERFKQFKIKHEGAREKFSEQYLSFEDPDGLKLNMIISNSADQRIPWQTAEVNAAVATHGFHNVTLTLKSIKATAEILTDILGYRLVGQEGNLYRFATDSIANANIVDLLEEPNEQAGYGAGGTTHHVAFRVKDDNILMEHREKVVAKGLGITPKIDRNYFFSLYFREPGGVLFELATDNPGFSIDEPVNELGTHLKLPAQYEGSRSQIEEVLPVIR